MYSLAACSFSYRSIVRRGIGSPAGSFAVLAGLVSLAAGVARFVAQPKMRGE